MASKEENELNHLEFTEIDERAEFNSASAAGAPEPEQKTESKSDSGAEVRSKAAAEGEEETQSLWEKTKELLGKAAAWLKEHLPDGVANFVYGTASIVGRTFRTLAFGTVEGVGQQFKDTLAAEELKNKAKAHEHESRAKANEESRNQQRPEREKDPEDENRSQSDKETTDSTETPRETLASRFFRTRKMDVQDNENGMLQVNGTSKDGKPYEFQIGQFVHTIEDWDKMKEVVSAARYLSYSGLSLQDISDGKMTIMNQEGLSFQFDESRMTNDLKSVVADFKRMEQEEPTRSEPEAGSPNMEDSSPDTGTKVHVHTDEVEIIVEESPVDEEARQYLEKLQDTLQKSNMEILGVDKDQKTFTVRKPDEPAFQYPIQLGMNSPEKISTLYDRMQEKGMSSGDSYADFLQDFSKKVNRKEHEDIFHTAGFHLYANEAPGSNEVYVFPFRNGQMEESCWKISAMELAVGNAEELSEALFSAGVYQSGYELEDDKVIGLTNCQVESAVTALSAADILTQPENFNHEVRVTTEVGQETVRMSSLEAGQIAVQFRNETFQLGQSENQIDIASLREELADSLPLYQERSSSDLEAIGKQAEDPMVTEMILVTIAPTEEQTEIPPPEPEEFTDIYNEEEAEEIPVAKTAPGLDDSMIL